MSRDKDALAKALGSLDGAKILRRLSMAAPIPGEGIVAGQSVSSEIMRMLGISSRGPLNDVDVFLSADGLRGSALGQAAKLRAEGKKEPLSNLANHVTEAGIAHYNASYCAMFHATIKEGYKILATSREGMLNEIAFESLRDFPAANPALAIARGFDLNCVQSAIDTATGQLAWTAGFLDFLASFDLRVANVNTPHHTAIRYFKKRAELSCGGDDELNMAICALPSAHGAFEELESDRPPRRGVSHHSSIAGRYGKKAHADALVHAASLAPWFKEVPAAMRSGSWCVWTMEPSFEGREATLATLRRAVAGRRAGGGGTLWNGGTGALLYANAATFCEFHLRPEAEGVPERRRTIDALEKEMIQAGAGASQRAVVIDLAKARPHEGDAPMPDGAGAGAALALLTKQDPRLILCEPLSKLGSAQQARLALLLSKRQASHGIEEVEWLLDLMGRPHGHERLDALLLDLPALGDYLDAKVEEGRTVLAPPLDLASQAGFASRAAASLLGVRFEEASSPNAIRAFGTHVAGLREGWALGISAGASRLFKAQLAGDPAPCAFEATAPDPAAPKLFSGRQGMFKRSIISTHGHASAIAPAVELACDMLCSAWGLDKKSQLVACAPAIADALEQGLIVGSKQASAKTALRSALEEAERRLPMAARIHRRLSAMDLGSSTTAARPVPKML